MWLLFLLVAPLLNAAVAEVTVYPQGALLKEERTLEIKKGVSELSWGALGQSVDADSLRVELPASVRLLDREVKVEHVAAEQNAARSGLEKELKSAQAKLDEIGDNGDLIAQNEKYLDQIQQASTLPVKGEAAYSFPAPAQWISLMDFVRQQRGKLQAERRVLEADADAAQKEVARLQRQLQELDRTPTLFVRKLTLKLEALKDVRGPVTVSYFDPQAGWRPSYQVWVDPAKDRVSLGYCALVRQGTSGDWSDVALTLSTARPQQGTTPPELPTWWVAERPETPPMPQPVYGARGGMHVMAKSAALATNAAVFAEDAMAPQAAFAPVVAVQNLTFAEFKIPGQSTLPADNQEHRVLVAELPLQGELAYKVAPEFSREAYLQAKVTNSSDFTLLPGETQLYVSGNFVGRGILKNVQPGEKFDLNLGADPAVKVERKTLSRKTELAGLMEDVRRTVFAYELTLTNLKASPEKVVLQERLPVSQHEKIKVELAEPRKMKPDAEGRLTWELELQPKEKRVLKLEYSVEHPKKMQVEGL